MGPFVVIGVIAVLVFGIVFASRIFSKKNPNLDLPLVSPISLQQDVLPENNQQNSQSFPQSTTEIN